MRQVLSLSLMLLHLLQLLLKHHVLAQKLLLEAQYLLRVHLLFLMLVLLLTLQLLALHNRRLSCQLVIGESCKLLARCGRLVVSGRDRLNLLGFERIVQVILRRLGVHFLMLLCLEALRLRRICLHRLKLSHLIGLILVKPWVRLNWTNVVFLERSILRGAGSLSKLLPSSSSY